jgi:hypothetical protein
MDEYEGRLTCVKDRVFLHENYSCLHRIHGTASRVHHLTTIITQYNAPE